MLSKQWKDKTQWYTASNKLHEKIYIIYNIIKYLMNFNNHISGRKLLHPSPKSAQSLWFQISIYFSYSSVDERYTALCKIAKTRSIISCGLSCFEQMKSNEDSNQRTHKVQTFNLFLLCDDEYTVESQSLQFLVKHGFDFNKQYSLGIPYHKGYQEVCFYIFVVHIAFDHRVLNWTCFVNLSSKCCIKTGKN